MKMKSSHTLKLSTRINRATGKNMGYLQNAAFTGAFLNCVCSSAAM